MALSPDSRHRSRLIREMSRDLNRTANSVASSTGSHHGTVSDSTTSDFDPEHEAIMSTRQLDLTNSQKLPELRDTAKKYGRWNGGRQQDFVINTSAIGRAFPDFSQGGSSDDDFSVEVGRGPRTRQRTPSRMPHAEYSDNIDSPAVKIGNFEILSTPPLRGQVKTSKQQESVRSSAKKDSHSKRASSSQKENVPPQSAPITDKASNYISGATRTSNGEQRRTLAELHARVADESEGSLISDERPPTVTFLPKNSRFSTLPRKSPLSAVQNVQAAEDINPLSRSRSGQSPKPSSNLQNTGTINSNTPNPTGQSFLLPNLQDISDIIAGTSSKNGTPVFARNGKVHSRFTSVGPSFSARNDHNPLDGIPVPEEEKAIFLSLQLLQDKVAALETDKADAQRIAEELQRNNFQLQAEIKQLEKYRRTDSGLGMADSGSDGEHVSRKRLLNEKSKLEANVQALQSQLDASEQQISSQEVHIRNVTTERDHALRQLNGALSNAEQLKAENATLRQENEALKRQLAHLTNETEENTRKWQQKEKLLKKKVQRREEAVTEIRELTREIEETQQGRKIPSCKYVSDTTGHKGIKTNARQSNVNDEQDFQLKEMNRLQAPSVQDRGSRSYASVGTSMSRSQSKQRQYQRSRSRSQSRSRRVNDTTQDVEESDIVTDGPLFDETTKTIHKDINIGADDDEESEHGSNYSSILGHGEMERLRRVLATERAKQERLAANERDDTVQSNAPSEAAQSLRRKSSSKGLSGILKNGGSQNKDDNTGRLSVKSGVSNTSGHQRRHSENSINTKRRTVTEEVTSAFILPDITIHGAKGVEKPVLSESARRVLDNIAQHDGHNCTVCTRIASFESNSDTIEIKHKQTVRIEKPIPVSDRMPTAGPYEDEPTMRPSVSPGLALATVMKALQDELAHLKMELAQYQAMFNKHDASLSKRKRKAIKARIESLLKAIDKKADQIYSLYDVLEGQKESGQELTEEEVEITLHNIGVDVDALSSGKNARAEDREDDESDADSDVDSDLDLPWEGIEDTTGTDARPASANGKERRQSWHA